MGGGGRYPYPRFVWSPAGGWWSQPTNWKMNTFIVSCGMALVCGAIIRGVAHREAELAGEPLERRRLSVAWRDYLHKRNMKSLKAAETDGETPTNETTTTE